MTTYTVHAPGIESVDNSGLREDVFFVEFSPCVPSVVGERGRQEVLQTTITGRSRREIASTEASGWARMAQWDEIEELFFSHLERFDSLYRRLA